MFAAYTEDIKHFSKIAGSKLEGVTVTFDLSNPFVVVGLVVGGMLPYLFGSMGMQAVGRAVVSSREVRRQLKIRVYEKERKMTMEDWLIF